MCGIAGLMMAAGAREGLIERAQRMADTIAHRGPDDAGVWGDPTCAVALGFRRLAILDLSPAGHQPMAEESGRFVVVFNGEIYNFVELRRELQDGGATFRGGSDTEVILQACLAWGPARAVRRFRGMFAFALWDATERCLWLARDRMGIKPLYLYSRAGIIAFCSELKGLMALPELRLELDEDAARAVLHQLYVPGPTTIFRAVEKVAPGALLRIDAVTGARTEERFWDLAAEARAGVGAPFASGEEAGEALESVLADAVRLRLRADVPVGAFLSGGVDSSLVVAVAQELTSDPLRTFTIGFPEAGFDESAHARNVASHLGTRHTEVPIEASTLQGLVADLPVLFDEPFADPSALPTVMVSRVARRDVTVALSGDGGDELFAGYNRYRLGAHLLPLAGTAVGRVLARGAGVTARLATLVSGLQRTTRLVGLGPQLAAGDLLGKAARALGARSESAAYAALLSPGALRDDEPARDLESDYERAVAAGLSDPARRMMLADQLGYLPEDLLAKVDRASMSTALEVRVPLLDHELVRVAWRCGAGGLDPARPKWMLRQALYKRVPRALVDRPKMGFTVPIASWLVGPMAPWAAALIADTAWDPAIGGPPPAVLWRRFVAGERTLALRLWAMLMLLAWRRHWRV